MSKINFPFEIYFESAQEVVSPFHFEAKILFKSAGAIEANIRFLGREDFTEADLLAQGMNPKAEWNWQGKLSEQWIDRIFIQLDEFGPREMKLPEGISFLCLVDSQGKEFFPQKLTEEQEEFSNELMQAIFELAGIEQGLYLGFQFRAGENEFKKITGEVSFANLSFTYNFNEGEKNFELPWKETKILMNQLFLGEFDFENGEEIIRNNRSFSVYIGDGYWYTAGKSWAKPRGHKDYFDKLEFMLKKYFTHA